MNLPTEVRYRPYADWSEDEIKQINENVARSPWHATYHIEPKTGLLNDPNGFSFFNGKFTLFFQNWPFGAAMGLKSWVHTESTDLVHFKETGAILLLIILTIVMGLILVQLLKLMVAFSSFIQAMFETKNWVRNPLQVGAWMDADGKIEKFDDVLIQQPSDVTEHFRDPQIFDYKGQFYAIVGAQSRDKRLSSCIKRKIMMLKIGNSSEIWILVAQVQST